MRFDGIITDPPYGIRAGFVCRRGTVWRCANVRPDSARKAGQRREAHRRTVDTR